MNTWTPTALQSEAKPWQGAGWRAVEAQHQASTMALALGNLADQAILENILDEVKPVLPVEAVGLHWLLSTPFRYFPPRGGSRFRKKRDPGVFYGADDRKTACAEAGYWRWRFWMDSEALQRQSKTIQITLFEFHAATDQAIDLTQIPFSSDRAIWTHALEYSATQQLAGQARAAEIELIRYESVRNPGGKCLAILTAKMFKNVRQAYFDKQQTWNLHIQPPYLTTWQRELHSEESFVFDYAIFV